MERELTVKRILNYRYQHQKGDYIDVNVVWASDDYPKPGVPSKFILADRVGYHIGALISFDESTESLCHNAWKKLKGVVKCDCNMPKRKCLCQNRNVDTVFCLRMFKIENVKSEMDKRILRTRPKQLVLSCADKNIEPRFDLKPKVTHLPFYFTPLDKIGETKLGKLIDVIGYVTMPRNECGEKDECQVVTLASARSVKSCTKRDVYCYDDFKDRRKGVTRKEEVYAFLNVKVFNSSDDLDQQHISLKTCSSTIIVHCKIPSFPILPPRYQRKSFVLDLFPRPRQNTPRGLKQEKDETKAHKPKTEPNSSDTPKLTNKSKKSLTDQTGTVKRAKLDWSIKIKSED